LGELREKSGMFDHKLIDVGVRLPDVLEKQPFFGQHFSPEVAFNGVYEGVILHLAHYLIC
jgi:hypothetical protein